MKHSVFAVKSFKYIFISLFNTMLLFLVSTFKSQSKKVLSICLCIDGC